MSTGPNDRGYNLPASGEPGGNPVSGDSARSGAGVSSQAAEAPASQRRPDLEDTAASTAGSGTAASRTTERSGDVPRDHRDAGNDPAGPLGEENVPQQRLHIGVWLALILGAVILILLLVFVIQNNTSTQFEYLGAEFSLPLGAAMLLAAIAGALVMALVGSVRMIQMSWTIRQLRKSQETIRRTLR